MLFNSLSFALFLPVVFFLYWFAAKENLRNKNILLLISSYFFYGSWDSRFLSLLIISTFLDFYTGIRIHEALEKNKKKRWLWVSIGINLGFLGFFKYFNFFLDSFVEALSILGFRANISTLQVILPLGISFYTFHGLSYIIDIYNGKIKPERNFINYSVFVCFFPLLIAGPIARATHLLPQIIKNREFDYSQSAEGLRQILWGLFKKIVIADNCARITDLIFSHSGEYSGSTLVLGGLFFTFQIYCDFSGYSDIAIGTARLFGIELLRNFAFPFFSRDIAEFWRRWHISLTTWFRDYIYIPLGGSKGSMGMRIRNIFIIFLLSGFWHGANWTYIAWGLLNAIYFLPYFIANKNRVNLEIVAGGKVFPSFKEMVSMVFTFILTVTAFILFRAESIPHFISYFSGIFTPSIFSVPDFPLMGKAFTTAILIGIFILIEWNGRERLFAISHWGRSWGRTARWVMYSVLIFFINIFMPTGETPFIYFQF